MAVPSRREAVAVLRELEPRRWFVAHVAAVAEIAAFLARRMTERGVAVDPAVVEAAALLHDVDKVVWDRDSRPAPHGEAGARWLADRGFPELGPAMAGHPVTTLGDDARYQVWQRGAGLEARVVAYADKRAGRRLESMADRFAEWRRKHPENAASLDRAWRRARALEDEVCRLAGVEPDEVRRLRWVRAAGPSPTASRR